MKIILTMVIVLSSSFSFASSTREAAALEAFRNSSEVKIEISKKCSSVTKVVAPIAVGLEEGDVMDEFDPVLVIQQLPCVFNKTSVAAIVKVSLKIVDGTIVPSTQAPKIIDLTALAHD